MTFTFNGKRYRFYNSSQSRLPAGDDGKCDQQDEKRKGITIRRTLKGERRLDVLIHEMIHASCWDLAEETVGRMATEIAHALWRLGYRGEK